MSEPVDYDPASIGHDRTVGLPPTRSDDETGDPRPHGDDPAALLGARLGGRYDVQSVVGTGGMGAVYRALDRELDEAVALKVIRPELAATDGMLERFRREVKLARRVAHPNVARMYELGEHRGVRFLTMELVDGTTLARALLHQRIAVDEAASIARSVCEALGACHAVGVIHRDVKPDNVMLATAGRVVLTDFGIARAVVDDVATRANRTEVPTGTPAYMAPEQLLVGDITPRADLYALGVMMFEMFTGALPWTGDSVYAVAMARFRGEAPDPRSFTPSLPAPLAEAVLRCMQRDPDARFASAAELASVLTPFTRVGASSAALALVARAEAPANDAAISRPRTPTAPAASGRVGVRSLAVLPFRCEPAEDAYLADGLTEDLIDALSTVRGLRVLARGAVLRFRAQDVDAREVGRELAVQLVVDGSLRRAGTSLRIATRLIGADDGYQRWASRTDLPVERVPDAADEVARSIAAAVMDRGEVDRGDGLGPMEPAAVEPFFRARQAATKRLPDALRRAVELFDKARSLAPDDPRVLAAMARTVLRAVDLDVELAAGTLAAAHEGAERAAALAPAHAQSQLARACSRLARGDAPAAARSLRSAIAHAPGLAEAHERLGFLLIDAGCPREGARRLETAATLRSPRAGDTDTLRFAGDDDAREAARWIARLTDGTAARFVQRLRAAAWVGDRARIGALGQDLARVRERERVDDALLDTALACLGTAPDDPSLRTRAERVASVALARDRDGTSAPRALDALQLAAECTGYAGLPARTHELLRHCNARGLLATAWLDHCPLLRDVRDDPRFTALRAATATRAEAVHDAVWPG